MANIEKTFQINDAGIQLVTNMYSNLCDLNSLYNQLITGQTALGEGSINSKQLNAIQNVLTQNSKFKTNFNQDILTAGHKIISSAINEIELNTTPECFNELFTIVRDLSRVEANGGFLLSPNAHKILDDQNYSIYDAMRLIRRSVGQTYKGIDELQEDKVEYFEDRFCQFFDSSELNNILFSLQDLSLRILSNAKVFNASLEMDNPSN